MSTTTLNISLPEAMKLQVEELVRTEGYGNTSEFFRDLVRGYLKERQDKKVEALILEGLNSGAPTPFSREDFTAIRERGLERIRRRNRK